MLRTDFVFPNLEILKKNLNNCLNVWDLVLGTDLAAGAGLMDGNVINRLMVISYVESVAAMKVWLELILTAVLFL